MRHFIHPNMQTCLTGVGDNLTHQSPSVNMHQVVLLQVLSLHQNDREEKTFLRPRPHYGRNDGDSTVAFYWSHYTFRNVNVALTSA